MTSLQTGTPDSDGTSAITSSLQGQHYPAGGCIRCAQETTLGSVEITSSLGRASKAQGNHAPDIEIPIVTLCNQIIHSWNWEISANEADEFDEIYVSSGRDRKRFVYFRSTSL